MKIIGFTFFCILFLQCAYCQDINKYYESIDSARYYLLHKNDTSKSKSHFLRAYQTGFFFSNNFIYFIKSCSLDDSLSLEILKVFYSNTGKTDTKAFLGKEKWIKYRNRIKIIEKKKHSFPPIIRCALKEDQRIRRKHIDNLSFRRKDSINQELVIQYFVLNPDKLKELNNSKLELIFIHLNFDLWMKYFSTITGWVKEGYIRRNWAIYSLERESCYSGITINLNDSIPVISKKQPSYYLAKFKVYKSTLSEFSAFNPDFNQLQYFESYTTIENLNKWRKLFF